MKSTIVFFDSLEMEKENLCYPNIHYNKLHMVFTYKENSIR